MQINTQIKLKFTKMNKLKCGGHLHSVAAPLLCIHIPSSSKMGALKGKKKKAITLKACSNVKGLLIISRHPTLVKIAVE